MLVVIRFGPMRKAHSWLNFVSSLKTFTLLLMTFSQLMRMIKGYLLRANSRLNIGHAFYKKPTLSFMEDIIK